MNFVLRRDFKHIQWGRTFQVMFIRAVGPAIGFTILMIGVIMESEGSSSLSLVDLIPSIALIFGIALFECILVIPWIGLICWWLLSFFVRVEGKTRRFVTPNNGAFFLPLIIIGLFGLIGYLGMTLWLMLGDPIVFFVHKRKPGWVPVQKYNFLNFVPIMFVLDPDYVNHLHMTSQTA